MSIRFASETRMLRLSMTKMTGIEEIYNTCTYTDCYNHVVPRNNLPGGRLFGSDTLPDTHSQKQGYPRYRMRIYLSRFYYAREVCNGGGSTDLLNKFKKCSPLHQRLFTYSSHCLTLMLPLPFGPWTPSYQSLFENIT